MPYHEQIIIHCPGCDRSKVELQHRARLGQLDAAGLARLRGWEALVRMIERQA